MHQYHLPLTKKGWLLPLSGLTESVKPWVNAFIGLAERKRKICSYCDCLSWSRSFNICNNSFDHLVLASSGGFEHWQWRSNLLPTLHQWVLPQLGRQDLHPAGSEIGRSFFKWFYLYLNLYLYSYRPDCRRIFSDWKILGAKMFYCNALGQSCPVNTPWSSTHVGF